MHQMGTNIAIQSNRCVGDATVTSYFGKGLLTLKRKVHARCSFLYLVDLSVFLIVFVDLKTVFTTNLSVLEKNCIYRSSGRKAFQ